MNVHVSTCIHGPDGRVLCGREEQLSAHLWFHSYPEELKRQTAALEETRVELDSVQNQLALARSEIETIKAVATVCENTKQEAIDQVRSQWQEEVASLQAIMKGKHLFTFTKST